MAFWTDAAAEDPKRKFNFLVEFSATPGTRPQSYHVKTASLPKFTVNKVEGKYFNHTFKYPGRVTWDPITVTLVDPVEPDLSWAFLNVLGASGYKYPTTATRSKLSLSKKEFANETIFIA